MRGDPDATPRRLGSAGIQSATTTIEPNCRAQFTPWFSLMPNLQYVSWPNGVTTIPNAFVLGLHDRNSVACRPAFS